MTRQESVNVPISAGLMCLAATTAYAFGSKKKGRARRAAAKDEETVTSLESGETLDTTEDDEFLQALERSIDMDLSMQLECDPRQLFAKEEEAALEKLPEADSTESTEEHPEPTEAKNVDESQEVAVPALAETATLSESKDDTKDDKQEGVIQTLTLPEPKEDTKQDKQEENEQPVAKAAVERELIFPDIATTAPPQAGHVPRARAVRGKKASKKGLLFLATAIGLFLIALLAAALSKMGQGMVVNQVALDQAPQAPEAVAGDMQQHRRTPKWVSAIPKRRRQEPAVHEEM